MSLTTNYRTLKLNTILFFALFLLCLVSCKKGNEPKQNPNILLIVTDDQAYGDLSLNGNTIAETPTLDKLAKNGFYSSQFYVAPVCAPTRAGILTGRYHQRTGVSGVTRGREDMKLSEQTMADVFKDLNYTTAIFGKWHNGAHYPYHPMGRGFDEFVGFTSGHWSNYFNTTIEKNGSDFKAEGYLPDVLTDEAIDFITRSQDQNKPFFCYIPYQTPHTPLQVPDKYFDKYKEKGADDFNATIYGMGENIDDNVQRLLGQLDKMNIRENTIVVYFSDNGPLNYRYNNGFKGKKGWLDEGGVRVPFILNWKGKVPSITSKEAIANIDLLPTLVSLIGHKEFPFKNKLDGLDCSELMLGKTSTIKPRMLFGEWSGKSRVLFDDYLLRDNQLFHLSTDSCQTTNVRDQYPGVYEELNTAYKKWIGEVKQEKGAEKPIPVGYDSYPNTILPAHEANLFPPFEFRKDRRHTGIAYHSLFGWAHDWIDSWTKEDTYAEWTIDVVEEGEFSVGIQYALTQVDKGVEMQLEIDEKKIPLIMNQVFEHSTFPDYDRIPREAEAPETDWETLNIGTYPLEKGVHTIRIRLVKLKGKKAIELKGLEMIKIS